MDNEIKKTILLVEDEFLIAMAEKQALEKYNYNILVVNSGEKAIAAVESTDTIDLILMDINLGNGLDGTEAAEIILRSHDIPLIFLSSHTEREIVEKTEDITSYGYIVKNLSETVLVASIKMAFKLFEAKIKERKKEEALRMSEERNLLINNSSRDCIYSYDGCNGRFTSANRALCDILQLEESQIIGKTHAELGFPPHICEEWEVLHKQVYTTNNTVIAETSAPMPDGLIHYYEVVLNPLHDLAGKIIGIGGSTRDISKQKEEQRLLKESDVKFRSLFQNINSIFTLYEVVLDNNGNPCDYRYLDLNSAFEDLVKMKASDLIGKTLLEIFPQTESYWLEAFQKAYLTGKPVKFEQYSSELDIYMELNIFSPQKGQLALLSTDTTERKKEMKLREQISQNYEAFFNAIDDLLFVIDTQGKILHTNSTVNKRLGYTKEELFGQSVLIVHPPERRDEAGRIVDEMLQGITEFCSVPAVTKSGIQIPAETRISRGIWNDQPVIFGVTKDISRLKLSEEKFSKLFQTNPSACSLSNVESHKYIEVNEAFYTLFGFEKDEVFGKTATDLGITTREQMKELIQKAGNEKLVNIETVLKTKNGDTKNVILTADTIYIQEKKYRFTTVTDITELKKTEEALIKSENMYRLLTESMKDVIWIRDIDTMHYTYISPSIEKLRGFTVEEAMEEPVYAQLTPENYENLLKVINQRKADFLSGKEHPDKFYVDEAELICKNGSTIWAEITLSYSLNQTTGHVETRGLTRDITEKKLAEDKIKAHLAEKELILKEVHHRIKNNMSTIKALLNLQVDTLQDPIAIGALEDASNRLQSMMILYDKLYLSSNYSEMLITEYLPPLIDQILYNFPNNLNMSVEKCLDYFVLDAKRLSLLGIIINELLTNIMKYAFVGRKNGLITISLTRQNDVVTLILQDNGNGIPESINLENSPGFGLMLIGILTKQLKGKISLERIEGTKVTLEFNKI